MNKQDKPAALAGYRSVFAFTSREDRATPPAGNSFDQQLDREIQALRGCHQDHSKSFDLLHRLVWITDMDGPLEERILHKLKTADALESVTGVDHLPSTVQRLRRDVREFSEHLSARQITHVIEKIAERIAGGKAFNYSEKSQSQLTQFLGQAVDTVAKDAGRSAGCADRLYAASPAYEGLWSTADMKKNVYTPLRPYLNAENLLALDSQSKELAGAEKIEYLCQPRIPDFLLK